jgi:hypothetical protein
MIRNDLNLRCIRFRSKNHLERYSVHRRRSGSYFLGVGTWLLYSSIWDTAAFEIRLPIYSEYLKSAQAIASASTYVTSIFKLNHLLSVYRQIFRRYVENTWWSAYISTRGNNTLPIRRQYNGSPADMCTSISCRTGRQRKHVHKRPGTANNKYTAVKGNPFLESCTTGVARLKSRTWVLLSTSADPRSFPNACAGLCLWDSPTSGSGFLNCHLPPCGYTAWMKINEGACKSRRLLVGSFDGSSREVLCITRKMMR